MTNINFPVIELENNKFQVFADLTSIYKYNLQVRHLLALQSQKENVFAINRKSNYFLGWSLPGIDAYSIRFKVLGKRLAS